MTLQAQYAQALHQLVAEHPEKGKEYIEHLKKVLTRKGHQKLMPRILAEYEAIVSRQERSKTYATTTPDSERTRVLLELYRTLVTS
jgi:F0F1-type ATP synthase delta subunit